MPPSRTKSTRLFDLLKLLHLVNGFSSAVGVIIGYLITTWFHSQTVYRWTMFSAAFSTLLIACGGFVINDIVDVEIDRINRPDRPLAGGRVSLKTARFLYSLLTLIGVALAWRVSAALGGISLVTAAALFLYSYRFKKQFLTGHLTIAALGALLFPFGGLATGFVLPTLYSVVFTFPAFFAREVLKTVPDYEGDRANGVDNIATRWGPQTALRVAQAAMAVTALSLPLVSIIWPLNGWFLPLVLLLIWPLTLYALVRATTTNAKRVISVSKVLFLIVALTLLVGSIR